MTKKNQTGWSCAFYFISILFIILFDPRNTTHYNTEKEITIAAMYVAVVIAMKIMMILVIISEMGKKDDLKNM